MPVRGGAAERLGEAELIARLRAAPHAASRLGEDTVATLVRVQVQLVRAIRAIIRTFDEEIATAVEVHPYAPLLASIPRIGKVNLGQVIGELGPILERAESCEQFIAETGVVPVTRASGKSHTVTFRYVTNRCARPVRVGTQCCARTGRSHLRWIWRCRPGTAAATARRTMR